MDKMRKFYKDVAAHSHRYPFLRYGQLIFNMMYERWPHIANEYRGSYIDPFYSEDNALISHFVEKCFEEIEEIEKDKDEDKEEI